MQSGGAGAHPAGVQQAAGEPVGETRFADPSLSDNRGDLTASLCRFPRNALKRRQFIGAPEEGREPTRLDDVPSGADRGGAHKEVQRQWR